MKFNACQSPARTAGFTLVEVLVSSLLTLMVMGMLFSVLMGTISAWEAGTSRLQNNSDAQLALDIIRTDLESMVVRQSQLNQEWMVSYPIQVSPGVQSTWLTFFAPSLDRPQGQEGDIVAVSYRGVLQDPISATEISPVYGLYKAMTNTTNTFQNVLGKTNIISEYWATAGADPKPEARAGFLAPHVIKFDVTWWVRDFSDPDSQLVRVGPERVVRLSNVLKVDGSVFNGRIEAADISLTTISDEGMRRYAFLGDPSQLESIIQEFGRIHTLRVPINY